MSELGPRQIGDAHREAQMIVARATVVDHAITRQWTGHESANLAELDAQLAQLIEDAASLRKLIARATR